MLQTGPTGNLKHQYEMLRDVTKRHQYLTTWDGNALDWRHKCCCLTATTESKGHHHLGWDINHTKMAHCFGQSLPEGICGVALIGTYQSCVKKEKNKKKRSKLERGSSDPANALSSAHSACRCGTWARSLDCQLMEFEKMCQMQSSDLILKVQKREDSDTIWPPDKHWVEYSCNLFHTLNRSAAHPGICQLLAEMQNVGKMCWR